MEYIIIGIIVLVAIMPFSIRNRTKVNQNRIRKKAERFGVDLDFDKSKK